MASLESFPRCRKIFLWCIVILRYRTLNKALFHHTEYKIAPFKGLYESQCQPWDKTTHRSF